MANGPERCVAEPDNWGISLQFPGRTQVHRRINMI
jgi:hypothetical protein